MRLLLVRHALCDPVGVRLSGRLPGVHLNEEGRTQALALAARLRDEPIAAVYTSPLERAVETAQAIAEASGAPLHVAADLTELDFGDWNGREIASLANDATWRCFNTNRSGTRAPGGEHPVEAQARAVAAVTGLARTHPEETVVIVSHGDIIRSVIGHLVGIPLDLQHRLDVAPASLSIAELQPWGAKLLLLNATQP